MGRLVVIEGLDGAGKRTLADQLTEALPHLKVGRFAFPRYDVSVHAQLVRDALHGRMGDLAQSVHGMALLFAMDRWNALGALSVSLELRDIVLVDRYVASNAAYGAARLHESASDGFVSWVEMLEINRFGIPAPHHQLYLATPREVAEQRVQTREQVEQRPRDLFESDGGLQARTAAVYHQLAGADWLSPWTVLDSSTESLDQALAALKIAPVHPAQT